MINIKVLDILNDLERNIRWLSTKANINYSTLYNFAHNNTQAVNYDILDKLCEALNCNIQDIIEHIPNNKETP